MRKKFLSGVILSTLFISSNMTYATESKPVVISQTQEETVVVPKRIETEIYNSIVQVYGEKNAKEIYDRVMQIAKTSLEKRPE